MTQPISNSVASFQDQLDKAGGVDQRRDAKCEVHGAYVDEHFSGKGAVKTPGWSGCPKCRKLKWDEEIRQQVIQEEKDRQARRIESLVIESGIPGRFRKKTFDNFEAVNSKAASHLQKIREYGDLMLSEDHGGRCLLMLGKVGNGKTHLACALLQQTIRELGLRCHYWTFSELVREVKGSFSKGAEYTEQDVYKKFRNSYLTVLDEVGMQNFTEFEQAVAYEAINARYLAERPTVLISNLQAKDLPLCVGERVVDRLREGGGRALDFDWKSYRVGGAQ